ncbi:toxin HipA [Subtercola boreus]|uniref:Toxin HipA n=1 Tax=Subtercola boreus TaxID=120213 RepID=A0A3E0VME0_9MICO|nr:HipA domain-containing protein [Subtercola boreus]RFA10789.1 toxin HipA [Subtercola boreus]TQL55637.1 serine/threonine-protein kinase HipA [Subtercola boreus]
MKLAVEVYGSVVGHIEGTDSRTYDFSASTEGVARFGVNSRVLSVAIPLTAAATRQHISRRRTWFGELLPEGDQLDFMLSQSGLRRGDTLGFLKHYGRDIAGAVELWDVDDPTEPRTPEVEAVSDRRIRQLLEDPLGSPLGNDAVRGRTSLAGVQPKIVLARGENSWARVLGGFPSTHILKPRLDANPTVIYDEEYGSRLARRLGLLTHETRIDTFDGLPALVIERFDRQHGERLHQEDFSQVLGASGNQKYQELGGVASLRRIAESLNRNGRAGDLRLFARMTVAGVAIGNLDMHTKNLGLLHAEAGDVRLAPAYDVVPMAHHERSGGKLALAVNKTYAFTALSATDLSAEISTWGVRRAPLLVEETLEEVRAAAEEELPLAGAHPRLQERILGFSANMLDGRTVDGR